MVNKKKVIRVIIQESEDGGEFKEVMSQECRYALLACGDIEGDDGIAMGIGNMSINDIERSIVNQYYSAVRHHLEAGDMIDIHDVLEIGKSIAEKINKIASS